MAANKIVPPDGFVIDPPEGFVMDAPDGIADQIGRQVGLTARSAVAGAATIPAMAGDAIGYFLNRGINFINKHADTQIPEFRPQMDVVEQNLSAVGLPEPETQNERLSYDVNKAMTSVAPALKAGQLLTQAPGAVSQGVGKTLATNPGAQIVSAGTSVGAADVAERQGAGPLASAGIGLVAGVGSGAAVDATRRAAQREVVGKSKRLLDLSKQHDVPLSAGDVKRGAVVPKVETLLEQAPGVGMGKYRATQHEKARTAALKVLTDLDDTGEQWSATASKSLANKASRVKAIARHKYDEVAQLADPLGDFPANKTVETINRVLAKAEDAVLENGPLVAKLKKMQESLKGGGDFTKLREFRSDLGAEISSYNTGKNVMVGKKGSEVYTQIRKALDDDMSAFAKKHGGKLYEKWRAADKHYQNSVVPLRETSLARLVNVLDPDELHRRFKITATNQPTTLYNSLGPRGRRAIKYGMVKEAFDDASKDLGDLFSPAKFAQYLEKRQSTMGVFFKGADKVEIDGFMNLMRHAARAGQYAENPANGNRLIVAALGAGTMNLAPTSTAAAATSAGLLTKLFTTDAGKKLMLATSKLKPGDVEIDRAVRVWATSIGQLDSQSKDSKDNQQSTE